MKIVLVTGGFDPLHSGHIAYFNEAKKLGDKLIVGLNSDEWLERKKGKSFMPWNERLNIVSNLKMVDEVYTFMDDDDSAKNFIMQVRAHYPDAKLVFANGGDRTSDNIPEMDVADSETSFVFGVGGEDKKNSSSWILKEWKHDVQPRIWGQFIDLFQDNAVRVKELVIQPGQGISYQRHFKRSEIWFVSKGTVKVKHSLGDPDNYQTLILETDDLIHIRHGQWHQAYNPFDQPVHIIEIQYGKETSEDDIERLEYYGEQNETATS
mgnify:CR=1 FL=1